MKKAVLLSAMAGLLSLFLIGCGQTQQPQTISETSIIVQPEGTIEYYLTEEFDQDYYQINELREMAQAEAKEYQSTQSGTVTVEKVEEAGKGAMIVYQYSDADTMAGHSEQTVYYKTVSDAVKEGVLTEGMFLNGKKEQVSLTGELLKKIGDNHVFVTDADAMIYLPEKIRYYSDGVALVSEKSVKSDGSEKIILIMK